MTQKQNIPQLLALAMSLTGMGLIPVVALADDPAATRGRAIAERTDAANNGFGDSRVSLEMRLRDASGRESLRRLSIQTLEVNREGHGDKSLVVFNEPPDVSGTALLSHARVQESDNQWLYLPALKRTKRISSRNKSGAFLGSEFAFEDFTAFEVDKYRYRWLREEPCPPEPALTCDVVERIPLYEHSGYSRQEAWVDQEIHQNRQVTFYDRGGDLLKTLTLTDYRDYNGTWRAHALLMENHRNRKSTEMRYGDYRFRTGLVDRDFVKGVLGRRR